MVQTMKDGSPGWGYLQTGDRKKLVQHPLLQHLTEGQGLPQFFKFVLISSSEVTFFVEANFPSSGFSPETK